MSVYFIRAHPDGPVKIGFTANIALRIESLQTASHQPLDLLRVIPGDKRAEKWLHTKYAALRINGEWFRYDINMMIVRPPFSFNHPLTQKRQETKMPDSGRADPTTLLRQAPMTAEHYMLEAADSIDRRFGRGYAEKHPELIAAFMQTSAIDFATATLSFAINDLGDRIGEVGAVIERHE